jgi:hypothetical protein
MQRVGAIAFCVIAIGAMCYQLLSSDEAPTVISDPSGQPVKLTCSSCKATFELSSEEYALQMSERPKNEKLKCIECGGLSAWRDSSVFTDTVNEEDDFSGVSNSPTRPRELKPVIQPQAERVGYD